MEYVIQAKSDSSRFVISRVRPGEGNKFVVAYSSFETAERVRDILNENRTREIR